MNNMSEKSKMDAAGSENQVTPRNPDGNDESNNIEDVLAQNDNPGLMQLGENSHAPLSQRVIEVVKKVVVTKEMVGNSAACCICEEDYILNKTVGKLACGHDFHVQCVGIWLENQGTCPICRQRFIENTEKDDDIQIVEDIDDANAIHCFIELTDMALDGQENPE